MASCYWIIGQPQTLMRLPPVWWVHASVQQGLSADLHRQLGTSSGHLLPALTQLQTLIHTIHTTHTHICAYFCTHECMYVCVGVCTCACTYVFVCVHVHVHVCVCVCVCVCQFCASQNLTKQPCRVLLYISYWIIMPINPSHHIRYITCHKLRMWRKRKAM